MCLSYWTGMKTQDKESARERYLRSVEEKIKEAWDGTSCVEKKWKALKSALCDGAKEELGYEDRKHPDWFRESAIDLKPLIAVRNRLHVVWLSTGHERDKRKHARCGFRPVSTVSTENPLAVLHYNN